MQSAETNQTMYSDQTALVTYTCEKNHVYFLNPFRKTSVADNYSTM